MYSFQSQTFLANKRFTDKYYTFNNHTQSYSALLHSEALKLKEVIYDI